MSTPTTTPSPSQTCEILTHLRSGRSITPREALDLYGITRLGARIWDLKQAGWSIDSERIAVPSRRGKRAHVSRYTLAN